MRDLNKLDLEDQTALKNSGVLLDGPISGDFFQQDGIIASFQSFSEDLDIMDIREALKKFPEISKYYGKAMKLTNKEYPLDTEGGYFIRVKTGAKINLPIQACLFLKAQGFKQKVHNLIILEENSSVNLVTGCTASKSANESIHVGVSEFFIGKNAKLNFTMIHSWKEDICAKPITAAILEKNATFISNYICLKSVRNVTMYPAAMLSGEKARAFFNSIILAHPGSDFDIGSKVTFEKEDTKAEVITKEVSMGGKVIARGHLKADSNKIKGHLECQGLLISKKGNIRAIPELEANCENIDLSHEASIGKINQEEIGYLRSRGISEKNAKTMIVGGFLNPEMLDIPYVTKKQIENLEEKLLNKVF